VVTRVALFGIGGKMGITLARAICDSPAFELAAGVDPRAAGRSISDVIGVDGLTGKVVSGPDDLDPDLIDVGLDFSTAHAALGNLSWCATHHRNAVCGTTGLDQATLDQLREAFSASSCLVAPNFAISAVLAMRFAELAAPYFEGAEVIELHHNEKIDAPSGTAIETARRIGAARRAATERPFAPDPTQKGLDGARGATVSDNVHIHAVRLPGLVAHQEVLFGGTGQSLIIRQDSYDRSSFVPGVLLALEKVGELSGLVVGLDALIRI
jgi:4-hydroxy-tetrahydrodipicolinate reductase